MKVRAVLVASIFGGWLALAASSSPSLAESLAQSNDSGTPAQKHINASAPESKAKQTTMTTTKHRYWRHRGGKHPHYGSRRVRS